MVNGTRTSPTVYESHCETLTLNLSLSLGLGYNRLSVPVTLCSHNLKHGPGAQRVWDTVLQGHNGIGTQWD